MARESIQYSKLRARTRLVTDTTKQFGRALSSASRQRATDKKGLNLKGLIVEM